MRDLPGRILESRNHVLERIACGAALPEVLEILTRSCEELLPPVLCSVLLFERATATLHHGAAPSLPEPYCRAIDGMTVGPAKGSCGTAAYTGQRVLVEDILTHPYWADYHELANAAGVRACWSEPILSSRREVLGTFAMYYRTPRAPAPRDLEFIETSAHIAGVAIERASAEAELERYRHRLEDMVHQRTAELERINEELRAALEDVKTLSGMLPICAWCRRVRDDHGYWAELEAYVAQRSDAHFSHGICPDCAGGMKTAPGD
jgi:GAF domain-containing protein